MSLARKKYFKNVFMSIGVCGLLASTYSSYAFIPRTRSGLLYPFQSVNNYSSCTPFTFGVLAAYVTEYLTSLLVSHGNHSSEAGLSDIKLSSKIQATLIQVACKIRLKNSLSKSNLSEEKVAQLLAAFDAGIKFPLVVQLISAGSDVVKDMGEIIADFFTRFLDKPSFERDSLIFDSPLKFSLSTAIDCGPYNPYCRKKTEDTFEDPLIEFTRFAKDVGIETIGVGFGYTFAVFSFYAGSIIKTFLQYAAQTMVFHEEDLLVMEKLIDAYSDVKLLDEFKRQLLVFLEYAFYQSRIHTPTNSTVVEFEDVQEAVKLGEKGKKTVSYFAKYLLHGRLFSFFKKLYS